MTHISPYELNVMQLALHFDFASRRSVFALEESTYMGTKMTEEFRRVALFIRKRISVAIRNNVKYIAIHWYTYHHPLNHDSNYAEYYFISFTLFFINSWACLPTYSLQYVRGTSLRMSDLQFDDRYNL